MLRGIPIGNYHRKGRKHVKENRDCRQDGDWLMDTQVNLKLWVKVRKEWRDSDLMKNYGYNPKDI